MMKNRHLIATVLAAAAAGLTFCGPGVALAESQTGWTGPTPPESGTIYLHDSTISNTPLFASSNIRTAFGGTVPDHYMGVNARLFKSGILCKSTGYVYNTSTSSTLTATTSGDCGSGSYNSNGYVRAWNGTSFAEFVTFPTNALNYSTPSASPETAAVATTETRRDGKSYGSAEGKTTAQSPDFIAAYGDHGRVGYIAKTTLDDPPASPRQARNEHLRAIDVVDQNGNPIDTFTITG